MSKPWAGMALSIACAVVALNGPAMAAPKAPAVPSPTSVYRLTGVVAMAGKAPSWDHLTYEPTSTACTSRGASPGSP